MTMQHCQKCGKELNKKMPAKHCLPCHNWIIAQARRRPSPKCIDCGRIVFKRQTKRCRDCNSRYMVINPTNPNPGTMEKSPAWKGGITKSKRGYIYIKSPNHPFKNKRGYVFEHRLVVEKEIGRFINKTEIVHHINGIKTDNRIENLELTTQSVHIKKHSPQHMQNNPRDIKTGRYI